MANFPVTGPAAWEPTHPGAILRKDVLPALGLSVAAAADKLGVSRQMLNTIVNEQASISPDMAVRLGKLCGNGPDLWIRMQVARDLRRAERRLAPILKNIPTLEVA